MVLTRDFKETIRARLKDDPDFRRELLREEDGLAALRGLLAEELAQYGGGEAFLMQLRTDPEDAKQ